MFFNRESSCKALNTFRCAIGSDQNSDISIVKLILSRLFLIIWKMWKIVFAVFLLALVGQSNAGPCESIQCKGPLFEMVQLRNIFGDNKKFVDRATKYSQETVISIFFLEWFQD